LYVYYTGKGNASIVEYCADLYMDETRRDETRLLKNTDSDPAATVTAQQAASKQTLERLLRAKKYVTTVRAAPP